MKKSEETNDQEIVSSEGVDAHDEAFVEHSDAKETLTEDVLTDEFPIAVAQPRKNSWFEIFLASKMWWMTLLCILIAIGLAWTSLPKNGTEITIQFPEGHGLKPEDEVRHRGISVGIVESVELNSELSGIDVHVQLKPGADSLAREGSRFWIVRPEFSLKGISGLETAVGSKYIAVDPGEPDSRRRTNFDGLAVVPPDAAIDGEGLEIILRGDEKRSINPGSPVTWRGVEVGRVISAGLSPDARYVDIHVRVRSQYAKLLRTNSKFWATSGVDLDFSLQGVKLNAESLETIARGGVSFITLDDGNNNENATVSHGHVFKLHPEADEKWLKDANSIRLMDASLPQTSFLRAQWRAKGFAFVRRHEKTSHAIIVQLSQSESSRRILLPRDIIVPPENVEDDSFSVSVQSLGNKGEQELKLEDANSNESDHQLAVMSLAFAQAGDADSLSLPLVDKNSFRIPQHPEDCWVVKSASSEQGIVSVHQSIGKHELVTRDGRWQIDSLRGKPSQWHGAPVVALEDSKIIGVLIDSNSQPIIVPISEEIFRSLSR